MRLYALVMEESDRDPWPGAEDEDVIFARLARRIRAARGNPSRKHLQSEHFVTQQEEYWGRHLGDLVNEALLLGIARADGLSSFGTSIGEAFSTTRFLLAGYVQLAGYVNDLALRKWIPASARTAPKVHALTHLHARSLVLIEEIFVLTTMGYPSGSLSLARTLHEVRVIAKFLHRFEAILSERYLDSHIVDMWNSRADFAPAGAARRSKKWLVAERELEGRFREVIAKHSESMLIENGWAMPRFVKKSKSSSVPRRIPFSRLEQEVRQPWDRARYRAASRQVHATHLGTIRALKSGDAAVGLLGPRPYDLETAAVQAMWDVQDVTESLLRTCGRFSDDQDIYYWLEALDQLSFVVRGSVADGQDALNAVFIPVNEPDAKA